MFFGIIKPKKYSIIWNPNSLAFNKKVSSKMTYKRFEFIHSNFTMFSKTDQIDKMILKNPKCF